MQEKSLQQLAIDFINSRSESSFATLYHRLKPGLHKYIYKYHQDRSTIDEILAITLSKAYVYADKYDTQWNFSTWVYKICQNECLMEHRRNNVISSYDGMVDTKTSIKAVNDEDWKTIPDYEIYDYSQDVDPELLYKEVIDDIVNLPTHYKEILEDVLFHKLSYQDISVKHGLKLNTVRSRIHSAKRVIKNRWIKRNRGEKNKIFNIVGITTLKVLGDEKPSKRFSSDVKVVSAKYGIDNTWLDVSDRVSRYLNSRRKVRASNRLGGDPCKGASKILLVEYIFEGKEFSTKIKEGELLII